MPAPRKNWRSIEKEVEELLDTEMDAAGLEHKLFGEGGLFTEIGTTRKQRQALVKRPIYRRAQARISELQKKEAAQFNAAIETSSQRLSGRLTVQVPPSLHAALKLEAAREGVSMAEMIRLKLGFPYRTLASAIANPPGEKR